MKRHISTLNTDKPNLYNMVVPAEALEQALRQRWKSGTPSNLGHDSTRLIGWMHPVSLYFEPHLTRLMGMLQIAETDEESDLLEKARIGYVLTSNAEQCKPYESSLVAKLGKHLTEKAHLIFAGCAAFRDVGILQRALPDVYGSMNKDGLINVSSLKHLGGGMFEVDGVVIFAHRFYRRSFSYLNNINIHFFESLDQIIRKGIECWIAVDQDLVGCPESYQTSIELEYWWGPKFSDDLTSIAPGVTRHEASEFIRLYTGVSSTEFWWQSRKGEHILEVEELRDIPQIGSGAHFGCRYLHCIVDEKSKCVTHIDGAVRSYSEEEMIERIDKEIKDVDRKNIYTKLWRIDDHIEIDLWKRLVSDHFRDNHLVGEYLTAEDKGELRPTTRADAAPAFSVKQKYTGFGIDRDSGIRVNLSYHESVDRFNSDIDVVPLDTITCDSGTFVVLDLWTIEIKKIISRGGLDLYIPGNTQFVACEDMYINLPLMVHRRKVDAEATIAAICQLLKWSNERSQDRAVSLNISYPLRDSQFDIRLSYYGHCSDLLEYFDSRDYMLPQTTEEIGDWCNKLAKLLSHSTASERPIPNDILQPSGILWLKRQQVPEEVKIEPIYSKNSKEVALECKFPQEYQDLASALEKGEMAIARCCFVHEVRCSLCGNSFANCKCSVVLDRAGKIIEKSEPIGLFLTDKPA